MNEYLDNLIFLLFAGIHWTVIIVLFPVFLPFYLYIKLSQTRLQSKVDLTGKTVVITGANSGIGYYTALEIASRNAHVILAGRNMERTEAAQAAIQEKTGNSRVSAMKLDVSLMSSVRAFAEKFKREENRLDILINNAGIAAQGATRRDLTSEGLEMTMATNYLGHFLLTDLLLDTLKKSSPSRIVNVASIAHMHADLEINNLNSNLDWKGSWPTYCNTKLSVILSTRELASRIATTGVSVFSLHPGVISTDLWKDMAFPMRQVIRAIKMWFKNSEDGAQTTLHCALAENIEHLSGSYFSESKVESMRKISVYAHPVFTNGIEVPRSEELAKDLWKKTEELIIQADNYITN